jgi:hypothetical protein
MKIARCLVAISAAALCAHATPSLFAQTASLYGFLRTDPGARIAALGGAGTALASDAAGWWQNPGLVGSIRPQTGEATFQKQVLDINAGRLGYVGSLEGIGDNGMFAVGVNYVNYGEFVRATAQGEREGTFSGQDIALTGVYSNKLDSSVWYGVGLTMMGNYLENYSSSAFGISAGLWYAFKDGRTNLGASILHVGSQLSSLDGASENPPSDVRLGISHRLKGLPLLFNATFHRLGDDYDSFFDRFSAFAVGGEFTMGKALRLRVGYDNARRSDLAPASRQQLSGFSGGLGLELTNLSIHYGAVSFGSAGLVHRISISANLGSSDDKP